MSPSPPKVRSGLALALLLFATAAFLLAKTVQPAQSLGIAMVMAGFGQFAAVKMCLRTQSPFWSGAATMGPLFPVSLLSRFELIKTLFCVCIICTVSLSYVIAEMCWREVLQRRRLPRL